MKKLILFVAFLSLLAAFGAAQVYAGNITIFDGQTSGSVGTWTNRGNAPGEDQEVEPGCVGAQVWDLEAFVLTGKNLSMIGGFNFKDGYGGFDGGDIFVDTVSGGSNVYGYEYAIKMNIIGTGGSYTVYQLDNNPAFSTVYFSQNNASNPWQLQSGGTALYTGTLTFTSGLTNAQTGFLGDVNGVPSHYSVELANLADYLLTTGALFHYTMECGNDNLMGLAPVPIPPTALLFGSGLLGVSLLGLRRRQKAYRGKK